MLSEILFYYFIFLIAYKKIMIKKVYNFFIFITTINNDLTLFKECHKNNQLKK